MLQLGSEGFLNIHWCSNCDRSIHWCSSWDQMGPTASTYSQAGWSQWMGPTASTDALTGLLKLNAFNILFIEGWGTASVYRMWWTFNYWTYFTYLFRSYWDTREPLSSSVTACVVSDFTWEDFVTFWKKSIFVETFKWDHLWLCLCLTSLLSMVLNLYIYQF